MQFLDKLEFLMNMYWSIDSCIKSTCEEEKSTDFINQHFENWVFVQMEEDADLLLNVIVDRQGTFFTVEVLKLKIAAHRQKNMHTCFWKNLFLT